MILLRDYLKQPELIQDYKFPKKQFIPKILPSDPQLRAFLNALPERYKVIFRVKFVRIMLNTVLT